MTLFYVCDQCFKTGQPRKNLFALQDGLEYREDLQEDDTHGGYGVRCSQANQFDTVSAR